MPATKTTRIRVHRRPSKVFVEIPPSPMHTSRPRLSSEASLLSSEAKSAIPLRLNDPNVATSSSTEYSTNVLKRKPSSYLQSPIVEIISPRPKRPKVDSKPTAKVLVSNKNASELPAYNCHQCNQKRDSTTLVYCNSGKSSNPRKANPCARKYCYSCVKNRYPVISPDLEAAQRKNDDGRVLQFDCPVCNGTCNCWRCRKAKGLSPLGRVVSTSSLLEAAADSVKTTRNAEIVPPKEVVRRDAPQLKWNAIATGLSRPDAEARIQIREFVTRFACLLDTPKTHLEELGYIAGRDGNEEPDGLFSWVNDACAKSVIIALLELLANESPKKIGDVVRESVKEIRRSGPGSISGRIWSAMQILRDGPSKDDNTNEEADSRASVVSAGLTLPIPDPLPAPSGVEHPLVHVTRRSANNHLGSTSPETSDQFNLIYTSQLVPVVAALTDLLLETKSVRAELDAGVQGVKEVVKINKECFKAETERWSEEKKSLPPGEKNKAEAASRKELHAAKHRHLDCALKVGLYAYIHRFTPLGTDVGGRVYYALSPGAFEQEDALKFATKKPDAKDLKGKKPSRRSAQLGMNGDGMRDWSWIIAVWGREVLARDDEVSGGQDAGDEGRVDDKGTEEKWWGFSDPEEILQLAEWVEITAENKILDHEEDKEEDDDMGMLRAEKVEGLVSSLKEYAGLLEWRRKMTGISAEGETASVPASAPNSTASGGVVIPRPGLVPAARFYGY